MEASSGVPCRAFLAIWHDITAGDEAAFELWHTREHMPERLSLPGFARGRRGVARAGRQSYLTLYESGDLGAFDSPVYRERLDHPTEWTARVLPTFRDFARVVCETVADAGDGVGGATATLRLTLDDAGRASLRESGAATAARLLELDGVARVLVGLARAEVSSAPTRETELRDSVDPNRVDAVVVVDGIGEPQLEAALPEIRVAVERTVLADAVYALSFLLTASDGGLT
jgi:hypothetical protein